MTLWAWVSLGSGDLNDRGRGKGRGWELGKMEMRCEALLLDTT
jgi:hypothetical protein